VIDDFKLKIWQSAVPEPPFGLPALTGQLTETMSQES
jgi:hypothetical protein